MTTTDPIQQALNLAFAALPDAALSRYALQNRASLLASYARFGRWTPRQESLVADLVREARQRLENAQTPASPAADAIAGAGLDRIRLLFASAQANGLTRPRISLSVEGTARADIAPARDGEALHIRVDGSYVGTLAAGIFRARGSHIDPQVVDAVRSSLHDLAENPTGTATAYGRLTGQCCFCRRALTDSRSVAMGYGPICAERFGLEWGEQRATMGSVSEDQLEQAANAPDGTPLRAPRVRARTTPPIADQLRPVSSFRARIETPPNRSIASMVQQAERWQEELGFASDPDFRNWRNEIAR